MNDSAGDDRIIGHAFRRSLVVAAAVATAAALFFGLRALLTAGPGETGEARAIAPQTLSREDAEPPAVRFTDITESSGIHHVHRNGAYGESLLPETMGGGIAVLDYDGDDNVDLLFVNGRRWPWRGADDVASLVLYRGNGTGGFSDVTAAAGLDATLYGMGAAIGDYDGDGDPDIFVTATGANRLFRNQGGEVFEDVTATAGVAGNEDAWSTGAAFLDYDRDGDLDLLVLDYVRWSREIDLEADYQLTGIGRAYGPPAQFAGTWPSLYRNDGGVFVDVSADTGVRVDNPSTGQPLGKGLAAVPLDVNDDGWTDIVVANDTVQNFLFINEAGERFSERGVEYGIAYDNNGVATGAMGVDDAVFSDTGDHAIAIGNFGNEMTSLYLRTPGARLYTDQAIVTGVGPASRRVVTFGLFYFDYDLDGRLDLLQANGHVENEISVVEPSQTYEQQPQLFWNCGVDCRRQFVPVPAGDSGLSQSIVGRGAVYADIDRDGDQDVVLTQIGGPPLVLRNDQATGHNWIQLDVLDRAGAPAYGAEVEVTSGTLRQRRRVEPSRSYLSQVETTLTIGIGKRERIDVIDVRWPDGARLQLTEPALNRRHRINPPTQ